MLFTRKIILALVTAICLAGAGLSIQAASFLFDATKAEMAGNADWVIDADVHNLKVSSASDGSGTPGSGNESNPQRYPTPDQSTVTASTAETYWEGALSAWAIDLVKNGQHVETLPYNGRITYGDTSNTQDLSGYKVFVMVEPNILFTSTEKTAIVNFVKNGGGLFIVSDHGGSDRNNDGADSVRVLNDLMTNSVQNIPFGFLFNSNNLTGDFPYPDTNTADPLIRGPAGTAADFYYNNGASIAINTNANASVKIAMWTSATHYQTNAVVVYATYGAGKVAAAGDSSPFDDGTGDPNDSSLYYAQGYADPSTSNGKVILNASLWLAETSAPPVLSITQTSGSVRIAWPASAAGYSLQATTNLLNTNSWSLVTNVPQSLSTNYMVTNAISAGVKYFRLKSP